MPMFRVPVLGSLSYMRVCASTISSARGWLGTSDLAESELLVKLDRHFGIPE